MASGSESGIELSYRIGDILSPPKKSLSNYEFLQNKSHLVRSRLNPQSANSVRQILARLRETVDRYVWVRQWGMGIVGNSSTLMGSLLASQHAATRANIALL